MNLDVITFGKACFEIFVSGKDIRPGFLDSDDSVVLRDKNSVYAEHSVYEVGGSGLVSAITLARQGIKTGCIMRLGKDLLSNEIGLVEKKEGITTEFNINTPEHHTDLNIHMVTERAHDIKIKYENSFLSIQPSHIQFGTASTRYLFFAELPDDFRLFKHLVNWARTNDIGVFLNIKKSRSYKQRQINYVLSSVNHVMLPMSFAAQLFNDVLDPREITRQLLAFGAKSVLLYDVTEEAYACIDGTVYSCGSYKNVNPLDMTGANDAFAAGYVAAMVQNRSVVDALTLASANACSVMEVFGSRSGILKKPALRPMQVSVGEM